MRKSLRTVYSYVPAKRLAFGILRRFVKVPPKIYQRLHFNGEITIAVDREHSFRMWHFGSHVENDLFWAGYARGWEATSLELWRRLVPNAKVILDVGANTGVYALAAYALNPDAMITAFEPVERVFGRLAANIELNGSTVIAEQLAASNVTGTAVLYDMLENHVYSASLEQSMLGDRPNVVQKHVRAVRLDEYLKRRGIVDVDLVKIDVEKHEVAALQGLGEYLHSSIPPMLVEVLSDEIARKLNELISGLAYEVYWIVEGEGVVQLPRLSAKQGRNRNFLLCNSEVSKQIGLAKLCLRYPSAG